ncbi:MAG: DNA replication and repair protein RecF [Gemmatimonadaceae bacterium]|nr:DNA replication and repair protein RecF [Gemmatimonadaceae bacterium]
MTAPRASLRTLATRDFRNFARLDLAIPDDGMVIVGENGHGKTNLLEAIHYLELFRSARGARDADLVRFGADGFHIAATVETDDVHDVSVGFVRNGKRKRVRLDGGEQERLSDAIGALPSVMLSPTDIELVAGTPAVRRRYLDVVLALTSRAYLRALQRYRGALTRRNAALRDSLRGARDDRAVAVWEEPLAEHGAVLWTHRIEWAAEYAMRFSQRCAAIGEGAPVSMRYEVPLADSPDLRSALLQALAAKRPLDFRRGLTHSGPHRDDLVLAIDGRDMRTFGSAGQQRTAAIALRIVEAETLRERRGRTPMFLLDDPFAELDVRRSSRIVRLLAEAGIGQTILAVPREADIPAELPRLERFRVVSGQVSPLEGGAS